MEVVLRLKENTEHTNELVLCLVKNGYEVYKAWGSDHLEELCVIIPSEDISGKKEV